MRRMTGRENCAAYGHRGDAVRIPYYTNGSDTEECDEDTRTTIPIERGER